MNTKKRRATLRSVSGAGFPAIACGISLFLLTCFPFWVSGQKETATDSGIASFYHDRFHGLETSSGEDFNTHDFTAAHRTLPFGTFVLVTNKQNNRSVVVRINDRGPFKKSRIIDLTKSAAMKLEMIPFGVVPVKITVLTVLDDPSLTDSVMKVNQVLDCFGNERELTKTSVKVWTSKSWKHAFYMASGLLLDTHLEKVFVKAVGSGSRRKYQLIVSGLEDKNAEALIRTLKKDGFKSARIISPQIP